MSLYAQYVRERGLDAIIETEEGFATYRYIDDGRTVYIVDIYVAPACRRTGAASHLADLIADEAIAKGATHMMGTVVPSAQGSTMSIQVLLGYGMTLHSVQEGHVVFRKDL